MPVTDDRSDMLYTRCADFRPQRYHSINMIQTIARWLTSLVLTPTAWLRPMRQANTLLQLDRNRQFASAEGLALATEGAPNGHGHRNAIFVRNPQDT